MATGRLSFAGASTLAVFRALALQQPPPPHEIKKDVLIALSALTLQFFAKPPQDRPQSVEAVAQAIARHR
jgi:hypothetical protein